MTVVIVFAGVLRALPHDDFGQPAHTHIGDHDHPSGHHDDPTDPGDSAPIHHAEHISMSPHVFVAVAGLAIAKPEGASGAVAEAESELDSIALIPPTPPPNA
jgi:hypothetical protein